jgi:hypothetical protein
MGHILHGSSSGVLAQKLRASLTVRKAGLCVILFFFSFLKHTALNAETNRPTPRPPQPTHISRLRCIWSSPMRALTGAIFSRACMQGRTSTVRKATCPRGTSIVGEWRSFMGPIGRPRDASLSPCLQNSAEAWGGREGGDGGEEKVGSIEDT